MAHLMTCVGNFCNSVVMHGARRWRSSSLPGGHGMEIGGENWLIPIDAELRSDTDAESETIPLRSAMLQVANASSLGLVILDSCRNNPFAAKMQHGSRYRAVDRGLARVEPTDNVLVAYAAKDGTTANDGNGRNSPFTAALLNNLEMPGVEINFLFRIVRDEVIAATKREQQPFVYGSLSRQSIYLKAADDVKPAIVQPQAPMRTDPCGDARTHWQSTETIGTIAAFEDHLARFSGCAFAALASAKLEALKSKKSQVANTSTPPPTAPAPSSAQPSPTQQQPQIAAAVPALSLLTMPPPIAGAAA
jgi:Caspase domain